MYAPYATMPELSRGRQVDEEESSFRSPFQRDRDRIIHASAFRRLKHKTQVFIEHEGDYFRTRLTHSIEVAQVARTMAASLDLNVELTEAVALAHDLGHTPFGHTGEEALDALMQPYGGFDHNAQALHIVTDLERHYAEGPREGWEGLYVSAYATMHPWEDWAETFALWLAMAGVLDTAQSLGINGPFPETTEGMVRAYGRLGFALNEFSREMGLLDVVPVVITGAIEAKLDHVTRVIRGAARPAAPAGLAVKS